MTVCFLHLPYPNFGEEPDGGKQVAAGNIPNHRGGSIIMEVDSMQAERVILVVPKPYIQAFPKDRQDRIWTIRKFQYIHELENL